MLMFINGLCDQRHICSLTDIKSSVLAQTLFTSWTINQRLQGRTKQHYECQFSVLRQLFFTWFTQKTKKFFFSTPLQKQRTAVLEILFQDNNINQPTKSRFLLITHDVYQRSGVSCKHAEKASWHLWQLI